MLRLPELLIRISGPRFELINLGFMLLLLNLALNQATVNQYLTSSLLISHMGFFLLWYPAVNGSEKVRLKNIFFIFIISTLLYLFFGNGLIALWIILLTGLTSGSALVNGVQRTLYALATIVLILLLCLVITPRIFHFQNFSLEIQEIVFYLISLCCLIIIIFPIKQQKLWLDKKPSIRSIQVDYLHSILISFGLFSFYTTSIIISFTTHIHYLQSFLITAFSLGIFIIILNTRLLPRHGIAGLSQLWEQHVLNIGNPFENWVKQTSLLGENNKITPDLFLEQSIEHLISLPWISGVHWSDEKVEKLFGSISNQQSIFENHNIKITLYSQVPMGSALKIHAQLLMHLMCFFYQSKLREISLKNQIHLKAIYETGSKLTHDIKNILQSLNALTGVVNSCDDPVEGYQLIGKQLPILTQRLQNTLDKLQSKTNTGKSFKRVDTWWSELQSRYHGRDILFTGKINADISIDTDVFDTILENLLENSRNKRRTQPDTSITTDIKMINNKITLSVCDSGEPISASIVDGVFKHILPSKNGYGIGLYQSAQIAEKNGLHLKLIKNEKSGVCFLLSQT